MMGAGVMGAPSGAAAQPDADGDVDAEQDAEDRPPTAALLSFTGAGAARARMATLRAASDHVSLIPQVEVEDIAMSLQADVNTPAGIKMVAEELRINLFLAGRVEGRGPRAQTTVVIMDSSGNEVARRVTVGDPRRAPTRRALATAVGEAITQGIGALEARRVAAEQAAKDAEARRLEEERLSREQANAAPPPEPEEPGPTTPMFTVQAAAGARNRTAKINLTNGETRDYDSGMFMTVGGVIRIQPFDDGVLKGAYALIEGDSSLLLTSVDGQTNAEFDTQGYRASANLGYMLDLGLLGVGAQLGYLHDAFLVAQNTVIPARTFSVLRGDVVVGIGLMDELLRADVHLGGGLSLAEGDLEQAFSNGTSAAMVEGSATLSGRLDMGLSYGAKVGYTLYLLAFTGTPPPGQNITANPTGASAKDGTDGGLEALLYAGWAF